MNSRFLHEADVDMANAVAFYNAQRAGLGAAFNAEVESAVARIVQYPLAWSPISKRCRSCQTRRFPYNVIFRVLESEILIVAIAHQRRRPGFWEERISE